MAYGGRDTRTSAHDRLLDLAKSEEVRVCMIAILTGYPRRMTTIPQPFANIAFILQKYFITGINLGVLPFVS